MAAPLSKRTANVHDIHAMDGADAVYLTSFVTLISPVDVWRMII